MGDLIYLDQRRRERARCTAGAATPAFYFDVSSPESYLTAERIESTLGQVDWIPVPYLSITGQPTDEELEQLRERAHARALALRLPLVWPEAFPSSFSRALRAAAQASEIGAGARFALAASRLHFCGGYDLDDVETLAEAAAAAGLPLEDCLAAAGDSERDRVLQDTAAELRGRNVTELPAIRLGSRWFKGGSCLPAAEAALRQPHPGLRRHAPTAVSRLPRR
jgi:2-hydroxychromene-2-carboxylate isomerase